MRLLLPVKPILTENQFDRIPNILDNAGQVVLGVAVFSPIISGFDKANMSVVILGLVSTIFSWAISIILARKKEEIYDI